MRAERLCRTRKERQAPPGNTPSSRLVVPATTIPAASGSRSRRAATGPRRTRVQCEPERQVACVGHAPSSAPLMLPTAPRVYFIFEVFQEEKLCVLPTSAWDRDTDGQRKEVTLGRSLSHLKFLPHCNGKQKSVKCWQSSNYFQDKILGPNSQSR